MLVGSSPRRVAVIGGARIPFARAHGAYAGVGNAHVAARVVAGLVVIGAIEDQGHLDSAMGVLGYGAAGGDAKPRLMVERRLDIA